MVIQANVYSSAHPFKHLNKELDSGITVIEFSKDKIQKVVIEPIIDLRSKQE